MILCGFNPTTVIRFELAEAGPVRLEVFDVSGRRVRTLVDGRSLPLGTHSIMWEGHNTAGQLVASGVYLYRMQTERFVATKRMVLMK